MLGQSFLLNCAFNVKIKRCSTDSFTGGLIDWLIRYTCQINQSITDEKFSRHEKWPHLGEAPPPSAVYFSDVANCRNYSHYLIVVPIFLKNLLFVAHFSVQFYLSINYIVNMRGKSTPFHGKTCAVMQCDHRTGMKDNLGLISFFAFPRDSHLKKNWELFTKRANQQDKFKRWRSTHNHAICYRHFIPESYKVHRGANGEISQRVLLPKAPPPSLFPPSIIPKKVRKSPKKGPIKITRKPVLCTRTFLPSKDGVIEETDVSFYHSMTSLIAWFFRIDF